MVYYEGTVKNTTGHRPEGVKIMTIKAFEIGKTYRMRSIGDHDCAWTYTVVKRTAKTVTITDGDEVKTCRINQQDSELHGAESIYPLGRYSMCPRLGADKEVVVEETPAAPAEEKAPEAPAEAAPSNVVMISQPADDGVAIIMIGQRVEANYGACYPTRAGIVVGFEEVPARRFSRGGIFAVIRWEDTPGTPERVRLDEIHQPGWRSLNGSPIGVFLAR